MSRPNGQALDVKVEHDDGTARLRKLDHILCVHQGYELYGSDRSFIQCVEILGRNWPSAAITVVIPKPGPILEPLQALGCTVIVEDLWIFRKKGWPYRFTIGLFGLFLSAIKAYRRMKQADLVYVNTAVVADYYLAARFFKGRVVAHIREIPHGLASRIILPFVRWSRATLIFNSRATASAFVDPGALSEQFVVHNGVEGPRHKPQSNPGQGLRILCLGRFNAWKGQDLLIEAVAMLPEAMRKILKVRLVGGTFEDQNFDQKLIDQVKAAGLSNVISILPFSKDPSEHLLWANVAVVPSRHPEPFGRVAIEAQSYGHPVIAAGHGGLTEIVTGGADGWLFEPNNANALAKCIEEASDDGTRRKRGQKALETFETYFSTSALERNLIAAFDKIVAIAPAHASQKRV